MHINTGYQQEAVPIVRHHRGWHESGCARCSVAPPGEAGPTRVRITAAKRSMVHRTGCVGHCADPVNDLFIGESRNA